MVDETKQNEEVKPGPTPEEIAGGRVAKTPQELAAAETAAKEAADKEAKDAADKAAADEAASKASTDDAGEPPVADDGSWKEQWVSTGNEHADAAIELMKTAGVKPVEGNEIFAAALESGDLKDVKWELLEARLGKAQAALVKAGVERYYETEYKEQLATQTYGYEQTGGKEGWEKLRTWAGKTEKSDPAFAANLAEYRKAIGLGGFAAKAAIDALKNAYEADPKNNSLGGAPLQRGGKVPTTGKVEPLSKGDYYKEMKKAGGDSAPESVKAALRARREAGRSQGI